MPQKENYEKKNTTTNFFTCLLIEIYKMSVCTAFIHYEIQIYINIYITSSVIFSAEFNPRGPNVSEIINRHRHLLETDDTLKHYFQKILLLLLIKEEKTCKNFLLEPTLTTLKVIY